MTPFTTSADPLGWSPLGAAAESLSVTWAYITYKNSAERGEVEGLMQLMRLPWQCSLTSFSARHLVVILGSFV